MKQYHLHPKDVQQILTHHQLGQLINLEEIITGLINPVYRINDNYILRIEQHTYEQNPDKLKREAFLFELLPSFGIPTPKLIGFDDSNDIISSPYILLAFVPGKSLEQSFSGLNSGQQKDISFQLGVLANKIHRVKPKDIDNPWFGNVVDWVKKSVNDFYTYWDVVKNTDYITEALRVEIVETLNQFKEVDWSRKGRLKHGDFSAGNIQVKEGAIVGIFDFEYASIADPLWDLQKLSVNFQLGPRFNREEFLKGYGKTDLTKEEKIRIKMHSFHQGVWEIWATETQFMPFGEKDIKEGVDIITSTATFDTL